MTMCGPKGMLGAAWLDLGLSDLLAVVVKVLAVGVGAVAGWFVGGWVTRLLVRLAFHRAAPYYVVLLGRLAGAVLAGWLAFYLINLGLGGSGGGSGGGTGPGVGEGKDDKGKDGKKPRSGTKAGDKARRDRTSAAEQEEVAPIRMLGGSDVKDRRFYLVKIKGKDKPMNREEVARYLKKHQGALKKKPLRILIYQNSVHEAHASIKYLESLAKENGWPEPIKVVSNEEAPPPQP